VADRTGAGVAPARAALAGNPSDGYGGAVLAVTVGAFAAEAIARVRGPAGGHCPPGRLVAATIRRFQRDIAPAHADAESVVECASSIPRSVGLGGSSAIVIATLRALCALHGVELTPDALAELALSIEVDDLGIAAGLQDRVAQAYGGVTFMEFADPAAPRYERLDPGLLPPLLVAWRAATAEPSGVVHGDLRARFERGDPVVRRSVETLGALAREARGALLAGDRAAFRGCVDATVDARAAMLTLDPRHLEMVDIGRTAGASVNYTGSGGAVVCVCDDAAHRERVARALAAADCGTVAV
jgi:glucuronokinase